ncbi:MAG: hypothetical protein IPK63_15945 [Candidatus Competibacteraceae bacterium]|nr:hypothetical protein [Candidatus Competibacteraceae bacterium]
MATAKQRAYAASMNRVIKRFETMEDATVKQMVAFLEQYRRDIIGYMSSVPDDSYFASFALGEIKANIENQTETLRQQLVTMQNGALQTAVADGVEMVVAPLMAASIEGAFFRSNVAQINVLMDYSADLIKGLAGDVIKAISSEIGRVGLGALTPYQAMQKVTDILGIQGGRKIAGGIAARAETIVRTETNRAFSVATQSQMETSLQEFPELQKAWMSTGDFRTRNAHLSAHGQIVGVNDKFSVGGEELAFPRDPAGSAKNTINCRCRHYTVHPEIGTIPTPLDDQIEAEKERRADQKQVTQASPARQGVPAGTPVSNALKVSGGKYSDSYRRTIAAIDKVHGDGQLPEIPIKTTNMKNAYGQYVYRGVNTPVEIRMAGAHGEYHEMTLAHEVGHFLDNVGFTDKRFDTLRMRPEGFSSPGAASFESWRNSVKSSTMYQKLLEMKANPSAYSRTEVREINGVERDIVISVNKRYINYVLDETELFARSYAQYIAVRSGDDVLLRQLKELQGNFVPTQWADDEFDGIAAAMDELFRGVGWIQ